MPYTSKTDKAANQRRRRQTPDGRVNRRIYRLTAKLVRKGMPPEAARAQALAEAGAAAVRRAVIDWGRQEARARRENDAYLRGLADRQDRERPGRR